MNKIGAEEKAKMLDMLPGMAYKCGYIPPGYPFIFVSDGCKELTGYSPEELADGLKFMDLVHAEDVEELSKLHDMTLAMGVPLETSFRLMTRTGTEKIVLIRSRVSATNSEGMPAVIEGLFTDITKRLRMKTNARENRENSGFWAKIGHGVRTPMNAILGLTELGLRGGMPDTVREYTHVIKKSGENLMSAMNSVMDFSKMELGELEIIPEEYSMATLVNDVVAATSDQIVNTGLDFAVYIDSKLPNMLIGDAIRIRQMLLSLLSNAVKFSDKGYVSLSITGETYEDRADLTITVEDTGHGVKEEDMNNLFKEFYQFDTKTIEGIGLGLTITRKLADLMGAEINCSSVYGVGSVFTICLPQKLPQAPSHQKVENFVCEVKKPEEKSVLLFERRKARRNSIIRTFTNLGVECISVSEFSEFYNAITTGDFSFVFIATELYEEFRKTNHGFQTDAEIIQINEPLYCVAIADVLNGGSGKATGLTAYGARVLIVDDISANLMVAEGLLAPYKMHIDSCETGEEAIEMVKSNRYDLILMDYKMPVMNGAETTLHIRGMFNCKTDCKNVPIIALTADTEYVSMVMFRRSGFSGFLPKPIDTTRLNSIIEKWIPKEKQAIIETEIPKRDDFLLEIPGIDVKKGLAQIGGNTDIYLRVIKKYYENGRNLIKELKDCMETGNTELYLIRVHALNSLSYSIGAYETSQSAAALEKAAERSDILFIQSNNDKFLHDMEVLLDNIGRVIKPDKKKVLLIDDTEEYLLILNDILMENYDTIISSDGEDGLETAKFTLPDLILLDVMMPGMSGYEVLDELKKDSKTKDIPVILVTGKAEEEAKTKNAAGFIKKPFRRDNVKAIVSSILKN